MNRDRMKQRAACGLLWLALAAGAAGGPALTLEDCLRIGTERSLTLANALRDREIAGEDIRQIRSRALPKLDADARYTWVDDPQSFPGATEKPVDEQYRAALTAEQLLYSGGSVRAALDAGSHYRDGAIAVEAAARRELLRSVASQFYTVLRARAAVDVANESLAVLEAYAAQTGRKHAKGMVAEFDLLTAQVRVANERPLRDAALNHLALELAALRAIINLETNDFTVEGSLTAPTNAVDFEALTAQALRERPELAAAENDIAFYDARVRVERGSYFPELRAFATYAGDRPNLYDPGSDEWRWGWQAGGYATWSLLDSGLRRGKITSMILQQGKAEARRDELRNQIRLQVQQAFLTLKNARETLRSSAQGVALAERALAIASTRLDQGMSTYLELTDGNLALSRARLTRLQALTSCRQAWIQLHYAAGGDVRAAATEKGTSDE